MGKWFTGLAVALLVCGLPAAERDRLPMPRGPVRRDPPSLYKYVKNPFGVRAVNFGDVTPDTSHGQSRFALVSDDPDRSWAMVWRLKGVTPDWGAVKEPALVAADRTRVRVGWFRIDRAGDAYQGKWFGCFRLPAGTKPGEYTLDVGLGRDLSLEWKFTVEARPKSRPVFRAPAGVTAQTVNDHLTKEDVVLPPGRVVFDRPVYLPAGATVEGYECHIERVRHPDPKVADPHCRVFVPGRNATVRGLTVEKIQVDDNGEPGCLANPDGTVTGFVARDVTLRDGNFGFVHTEALLDRVLFDGAGCTIAPTGLIWRCHWKDTRNPHALSHWFGRGSIAVVDGVFERTDRGPIAQTLWGDVTDNIWLGNRGVGDAGDTNASEWLLHEPNWNADASGEFSRNLIVNTITDAGCAGDVLQWDGVALDNVVYDLTVRGPGRILFQGKDCRRNSVTQFQLSGGSIYCGPNALLNLFDTGRVKNTTPDRGNQLWVPGVLPGDPPDAPCAALAVTAGANTLKAVRFTLPPGTAGPRGFTTESVTVDGDPAK